MQAKLDCIPCFIKQSLEAARLVSDDEDVHYDVITQVMNHLMKISLHHTPPELSQDIHAIIRTLTRSKDPYKTIKENSNKKALNLYNQLNKTVDTSKDPLYTATKLAIIGNAIDFGTFNRYNVEEIIKKNLETDTNLESYSQFKEKIKTSRNIYYLADNAGEVFFDKLLIEQLALRKKNITYVVKSNPIINDATEEDALFAGINHLAKVEEGDKNTKTSAPGFLLNNVSDDFQKKFNDADMVISKGQGNFESLQDCNRDVFFLLMVKCPILAHDLKTDVSQLVLKEKK
jgi:uncharacterized protein with ATP-grasp and redox domains